MTSDKNSMDHGRDALEFERGTRRFSIYILACALIYLFGAFFGQKTYIIASTMLGVLGLLERRRTRSDLSEVRVRIELPEVSREDHTIEMKVTLDSPEDLEDVQLLFYDESDLEESSGLIFPFVEGGSTALGTLTFTPEGRGLQGPGPIILRTCGGMGLIARHRLIFGDGTKPQANTRDVETWKEIAPRVSVYPVSQEPVRSVAPPLEPMEVKTGIVPGPASPVGHNALRPYTGGDNLRRIDWRATARLGQIVVLSTRMGPPDRLMIVVDTGCRGDLETVLRVAARALEDERDRRPRVLALASEGAGSVSFDQSDPQLEGRKRLARAQAGDPGDLRRFVTQIARFQPECELLVIGSSAPQIPSIEGFPMGFWIAGPSQQPREGSLPAEPLTSLPVEPLTSAERTA